MPSDIKERVVARNVKTLDRAALLQKAARPAALRVGETAKAANPAHTRERRGDEAEGGWAAARGESERTAHEGFAATANGARVARAIRRRNVPKERARTTFPSAERGERRTPRGCAASCGSSREASSPSPRAPRPANARAREAMRTRAQAASRARAARASRKATAKGANAAARRAASSAGRFARMAALQARAATAALTGLGSSAAAVVVVTCLAAFVATSAFGIFLMGGDIGDGNPPLREVVAEIDAEHAAKVEEAKASAECDEISVSGGKSPWKETLAVFAVKLAADAENPLDVLTLDAARQGALRAVFWDMNSIETEIEEAEPSDSDGEDAPPAKVLRVTLSAKTAEQMASAYGFDAGQLETLRELLDERHDAAWRAVLHGIAGGAADIVEIASSQLGNVGGRPYWSWYGFESRVEWCACFVSWCANECGYIDSGAVPKFSYCPTGVQWFKAAGRWLPGGSAPAPGDIVFFDWDGDGVSDHVGIVESCDGSTVRTIEGNSDDACRRSAYGVGSPFIMGYGACSF